jgi:DNA-binding CsgD family transcriptional regulator
MFSQDISDAYSQSSKYNSNEKVNSFWDKFKPAAEPEGSYLDKWLSQAELFNSISRQNRTCVLLWDTQSNRFVYAVDNAQVLGGSDEDYTDANGVHFSISKYPPACLDAALAMQRTGIEYCIANPAVVKQIILNHDIAYTSQTEVIHVLQQAIVVEADKDGHPLLFLSFVYNISHLKKPGSSMLVIKSPTENQIFNYDFERKKLDVVSSITEKEYQVLKMLGTGKNTKEISVQLFSSPHTIDTHRRNLLAKTNCVDTTALVTYCRMVGLL